MSETSKFSPEMESLQQEKQAVFEEPDLEKRLAVEQSLKEHDDVVRAWRENKDINGQQADTQRCLTMLGAAAADVARAPMARLSAYEHMVQLTERSEPQNRQVIEQMIEQALTEPNPRMQEAMLGILGSRFDSRIGTEPDAYFGDTPKEQRDRLSKQFSNSLDALINEIRVDERLPDEYRRFAEVIAFRSKHLDNEMRNRMMYMADLYRGDFRRLWPEFKQAELPPSEPAPERKKELRLELWAPKQKSRRLLPESHVPSPEKQFQADNEPRVSGDADEIGQTVPLRVFAAFDRPDGAYDVATLPPDMSREYISEMRRVKMNRKLKSQEERDAARAQVLAAWRERVRGMLTERDKSELTGSKDLALRVETLVDENRINTMLKKAFGRNDLTEIDPDGRLTAAIDAALESDVSDEEQMDMVKKAIDQFKKEKPA